MTTPKKFWEKALTILRSNLGMETYNQYLGYARFLYYERDTRTLGIEYDYK